MDLDTEDGNVEISSLLIQSYYGAAVPPSDHAPTDKDIIRGLQISPEKSGHARSGSRKFIRFVYLV